MTAPAHPSLAGRGEPPVFGVTAAADRDCPGRLLLTGRTMLFPLLRTVAPEAFDRQTPCAGWSVREVLAHCAAALSRLTRGELHDLCPTCNARDVLDRHDWQIEYILDELERGYTQAGPAIAAADGWLDLIALGEWVHAGDVREALGIADPYTGDGACTDDALTLLAACSRRRDTPLLIAELPGRSVSLGLAREHRTEPARLRTDTETLIRLYTGRPVAGRDFELVGAEVDELIIYR